MSALPPGRKVLAAFGVRHGVPHLLAGGQGRVWGVGDIVLKPIDSVAEAEWSASALAGLPEIGFRVSRPVRAVTGTWTAGGWAAWERVAGTHAFSGRWHDVLAAGAAFCAALTGLAKPPFLDERDDSWSVGDRVAWSDDPPSVIHAQVGTLVAQFASFVAPSLLPDQVIHGDLTGNMLFADPDPPAIIDFIPYWRPLPFALAIVVADAIAWHDAPLDLARRLPPIDDRRSMLARAAIYRLITADHRASHLGEQETAYVHDNITAHERVLSALRQIPGA